MNSKRRSSILLALIILFMSLIYIFFICTAKHSDSVFGKKGVANLKNWDWANQQIVELDGEWSFYPNLLNTDINSSVSPKFEKVPGSWEHYKGINLSPHGYGTYKLKVKGLEPSAIYGIELPEQATSYNLFANNKKIASNGIVSRKAENYMPYWNPTASIFETDKNGEVEFVMEIANFDYYTGGFWNSIKIGKAQDILSYLNKNKIIDMFIFSTIFIMCLFSLGLFHIYKRNKTTIYLAILCFISSIRTLLTNQRIVSDIIPKLNWHVIIRLEFLVTYLLLPIWGLFTIHLFEIKKHSKYMKIFFYSYIVFCFFITLATPHKIYLSFLHPNEWLSMILSIYFLFCIIRAAINKKEGSELMIYGVFVIIISMIRELFIKNSVSWLPFALLNFVICCFFITLQQFLTIIRRNDILEAKIVLDPLTGLYNREYLSKIEENFFNKNTNENKYILFMDLDRFKYINDTFGHKVGDFILQKIGQRLKKLLKDTGIICRYGGDEFLIIVTAKNDTEIKKITNKIINEIKKPFVNNNQTYTIGVSIGITEYNKKLNNLESIIKSSDKAMYISKKNGGNQYYFDQ